MKNEKNIMVTGGFPTGTIQSDAAELAEINSMMSDEITELKEGMNIVARDNPEWGTWTIQRHYHESMWEMRGRRGERVIDEYEAKRFWRLA